MDRWCSWRSSSASASGAMAAAAAAAATAAGSSPSAAAAVKGVTSSSPLAAASSGGPADKRRRYGSGAEWRASAGGRPRAGGRWWRGEGGSGPSQLASCGSGRSTSGACWAPPPASLRCPASSTSPAAAAGRCMDRRCSALHGVAWRQGAGAGH